MEPLSKQFRSTITNVFGETGRAWLEGLPELIETVARRWSLQVLEAFPELSYNYVLRVVRPDGSRGVLKLGVPNKELNSEIAALEFYQGRGIAEIYAADPELGALLIEELRPGRMLSTLEDDDQATTIAAGVMQALWRPAPNQREAFLSVAGWAEGITRYRQGCAGGSGPLDPRLVARAEGLFAELLASAGEPYLIHGDFHHYNILQAERAPWLAIDPKGVLGEPVYDLGAFLYNPTPGFPRRSDLRQRLARRVELLSEMLNFDRRRVLGYGLAQAVLSACWSLEGSEEGWEDTMRVAEELMILGG